MLKVQLRRTALLLAVFAPGLLQALSPRESVVTGQIVHRSPQDPKIVELDFRHPLRIYPLQIAPIDEKGRFSFRGEMVFTQDIRLQYRDDAPILLYCTPGDSTHVVIDAATGEVSISGDDAQLKDQIRRCYDYTWKALPLLTPDWTLSDKEYMIALKAEIRQRQDSAECYARRMGFDPVVAEWVKRDIVFNRCARMNPYRGRSHELYKNSLFDRENPENFHTSNFTYVYLPGYAGALHWNSAKSHGDIVIIEASEDNETAERKRQLAGEREMTENIRRLPPSLTRDFLIFALMQSRYSSSSEMKYPKYHLPKDTIEPWFTDPWFVERLLEKKKTDFASRPVTGISFLKDDGTVEQLPVTNLIGRIIERHPDEDLYIAMWKTRCEKCSANLQHASRLKTMLRKKSSVIYICTDSPATDWKKAVRGLPGEHYLLDEDGTRLLHSFYKEYSYPFRLSTRPVVRLMTSHIAPPENIVELMNPEATAEEIESIWWNKLRYYP